MVFDLDGTLLDTMAISPRVYVDTVSALGGPRFTPDDVVAMWHIGPSPVVLARLLGRTLREGDMECYYAHVERAVRQARAFPGVPEAVAGLAARGVRTAVYTAATRRAAELKLAAAGMGGAFDVIVCGDEVAAPKPAPDGLWRALELLGVEPARAAYVGDGAVDLGCARGAGAHGVHACWGTAQQGECGLPEPGAHAGSPAALADHLADHLGGPHKQDTAG